MQRVIIQLKPSTGLNEMFGNDLSEDERNILFAKDVTANTEKKGILVTDLLSVGGKMRKSFDNLGLVSAQLPLSKVHELMVNDEVAYISPDRETSVNGHLENTTGTAQIRSLVSGTNLDGNGIGIAVIDSGVDTSHHLHSTTDSYHTGIVYSKDFTGSKC